MPEVGLNLGFQITPWASLFAGYTFLYTNTVARPANQISRNINPTQGVAHVGLPATLTGAPEPKFKVQGSDFWAQGFNAGLALRF